MQQSMWVVEMGRRVGAERRAVKRRRIWAASERASDGGLARRVWSGSGTLVVLVGDVASWIVGSAELLLGDSRRVFSVIVALEADES